MYHSFDAQMAAEFGLHAAIIYNIIQCTPCNRVSEGYISAVVGMYMTTVEIKDALIALKNNNKVSGKIDFCLVYGE